MIEKIKRLRASFLQIKIYIFYKGEKQLEDLLNKIINHKIVVDKNDYL